MFFLWKFFAATKHKSRQTPKKPQPQMQQQLHANGNSTSVIVMICVPTSLQSKSVASPEGWGISGCLCCETRRWRRPWQLVKDTLGNQWGSEKLMRQVETKRAEQKRWESPHIIAGGTLWIDDVKEHQRWISPPPVWYLVVMKGRRDRVINLKAAVTKKKHQIQRQYNSSPLLFPTAILH